MNSIELTTTEFRQNQKKFLDLAAAGASLLICRGKELFVLNRVSNRHRLDDATLSQIDQARQEINNGDCVRVDNPEQLHQFLNSL